MRLKRGTETKEINVDLWRPGACHKSRSVVSCCREARQARGEAVHRCLPVIVLSAGLAACVSSGGGSDPRIHYTQFDVDPPQGNRINVCHAYTCKMQTPYTFSRADIAEIAAVIAEKAILDLQGPIIRVTGYDVPFPYWSIEGEYLPTPERVAAAASRLLAY